MVSRKSFASKGFRSKGNGRLLDESGSRKKAYRDLLSRRLCVEQLEDRRLLSVSTPGDAVGIDFGMPEGERWVVEANDVAIPAPLDLLDLSGSQAFPQLNLSSLLIGLDTLRADERFSGVTGDGFNGDPIGVAVLDTGIADHVALPNLAGGIDFADGDLDPTDVLGHGTHVAGVIGSNDPTFGGVAPGVNLYAVKIFGDDGAPAPFYVIKSGLQWVIDNAEPLNIRVVNMSLGSLDNLQVGATGELDDEIETLEGMGITVVSSSGNDYQAFDPIPGQAYPAVNSTLGVGAVWTGDIGLFATAALAIDFTTDADRIAAFSQRDPTNPNHVMAPGAYVTSTWLGDAFVSGAGTSTAAPHVSGLVALLQDAALEFGGRLLSTVEIVDFIRSSSVTIFDGNDEDNNVFDTEMEYLRIDAYAAVEAVFDFFDMTVMSTTPAMDGSVTTPPTEFVIDFSDPYLEATVDASDLEVNGIGADSVIMTDADTLTFQFAVSPVVDQGSQKMSMVFGAVQRASDSDPVDSFSGAFAYDEVPMEVVSITPSIGEFSELPLMGIVIDFNEPYLPGSIGTDDLTLSRGTVTGFDPIDADSVEYLLDGLEDDGLLTVEIAAGALSDAYGNPMQAFAETFELDYGEVPYPVPLVQVSPAGALIYDPSIHGLIGEEDTDSFLLLVDPGQKITVVVESDDALQPVIELFRLDGLDDGKGDGDDDDDDDGDDDGEHHNNGAMPFKNLSESWKEAFFAWKNEFHEAKRNDRDDDNDDDDNDDDHDGKGSSNDGGRLIAEAVAAAPGEDAVLQTVATHGRLGAAEGEDSEPRMYMVSVSGASGTGGEYTVQIILNAAIEEEKHDGPANDDLDGAQDLDASFLPFFVDVDEDVDSELPSRGAVLGQLNGWTTTVPGDRETLEGGSANTFPFHVTYSGQTEMRYQQIYSASEFTGEGFIDQLRFRRDRLRDTPFGSTDIDVTISLGYAATTVQTVSATFAENIGDGYVTVFDGVATISSEGTGLPNPFDIVIDIENLFRYDPAGGDLLVDISIRNGPTTAFFDASGFGEQSTTTRVFSYPGDVNAEMGRIGGDFSGSDYGLVTQFAFVEDADLYSFTLEEGENASLALTALTGSGVNLQLFDASGAEVATGVAGATNVDALIGNFTASDDLPDGDWNDDRDGNTYYVRVTGSGAVEYSLLIARNAAFDTENNDDVDHAQALGELRLAFGHVGDSGDVADVYSVDLVDGQRIRLATATPSDGSGEFVNLLDPVLVLLGPTGIVVAEGEVRDDGRNEVIVYTVPEGGSGTYSIVVSAAATGGEYIVRLKTSPAPLGTKFFVVDNEVGATFQYDADGNPITDTELAGENANPSGVTSNIAGTTQWVVDRKRVVYVYDSDGHLLGSWAAHGLRKPTGIATDEEDIWIVDARRDRVYHYDDAAEARSGELSPESSFPLDPRNAKATGITTDGRYVWVVNNGRFKDSVFKYTTDGELEGVWTIDGRNRRPTGITIDPADVDHIWIVDARKDKVFQYDGAALRTSGSQLADAAFNLAEGNTNPQGIADPPPTLTPVDSTLQSRTLDRAALSVVLQADSIRGTIASSSAADRSRDDRIDIASLQFDSWFEDATDDGRTSESRGRIRANVSSAVDRLMADLDDSARRSEDETTTDFEWDLERG